jgi:hypothetical protein
MKERPKDLAFYEWRFGAWRTSATRDMLDATGRGIYRELLDQCYAQGEFPSDPTYICRVCACTMDQYETAWKVISKHFVKGKNGALHSKKADLVRRQYAAYVDGQRKRRLGGSEKSNDSNQVRKQAPTSDISRNDLTRTRTLQGQEQGHNSNAAVPVAAAAAETGWKLFANEVRERFPDTSASLINKIAEEAIRVFPELTDENLVSAVLAATKPKQHSAALYLNTIPEVIRTWAASTSQRDSAA